MWSYDSDVTSATPLPMTPLQSPTLATHISDPSRTQTRSVVPPICRALRASSSSLRSAASISSLENGRVSRFDDSSYDC